MFFFEKKNDTHAGLPNFDALNLRATHIGMQAINGEAVLLSGTSLFQSMISV